jgi:hypothetical protein
MTAARGGGPLGGRPPANAAARGAVLVLIAVLIGALLLARGFDESDVASGDGTTDTTAPADGGDGDTTDTTATDGTGDDGEGDGTTDTTAPVVPALPPEEITVLVLNGSGVSGAAARVRDALLADNYNVLAPDNAERTPDTVIYHLPGWTPEAVSVATALDAPVDVVQPMPDPPPGDYGEAVVVVILGEDGAISIAG